MSWNKSYSAENSVWRGRFLHLLDVPHGMTIADQRAASDRILEHFDRPPLAKCSRGGRSGYGSTAYPDHNRILYGPNAGLAVVCHETAHIISPDDSGQGPEWRMNYVSAVAFLLGDWHAERLRKAFVKTGLVVGV